MKYLFTFLLYPLLAIAGTKEYVVGQGSEFKFYDSKETNVNLSIYVSESSFSKLGIEYYFSTNDLLSTQVFQQYTMGLGAKTLSLDKGYIMSSDMKKPEIMTEEFMHQNDKGVRIDDFFFSKESELEKYKIGMESVEVPAGTVLCSHYKKNRDDQVIDFWISDKAGAIGLVKLVSKSEKNPNNNYKIELQGLIKNIKAKINPNEAVPLTDMGRMFLGKPSHK